MDLLDYSVTEVKILLFELPYNQFSTSQLLNPNSDEKDIGTIFRHSYNLGLPTPFTLLYTVVFCLQSLKNN